MSKLIAANMHSSEARVLMDALSQYLDNEADVDEQEPVVLEDQAIAARILEECERKVAAVTD